MTPRVFRSVFARQKKRPRHCWRGLLDWVQKIAPFSVASIADSKNPILMQLKIGLVLFEIELVYHCRVGKGCGGPFLTFAPAVAGLAAVKIIAFSLLPV